jgi:hypothetical protein
MIDAELSRSPYIFPLIGLGCSPVLVSGTKKLFLKWIRRALRQKRIEVPDRNGPVRWSLAHSFFRIGQSDLVEGSLQRLGEESPGFKAQGEDTPSCDHLEGFEQLRA